MGWGYFKSYLDSRHSYRRIPAHLIRRCSTSRMVDPAEMEHSRSGTTTARELPRYSTSPGFPTRTSGDIVFVLSASAFNTFPGGPRRIGLGCSGPSAAPAKGATQLALMQITINHTLLFAKNLESIDVSFSRATEGRRPLRHDPGCNVGLFSTRRVAPPLVSSIAQRSPQVEPATGLFLRSPPPIKLASCVPIAISKTVVFSKNGVSGIPICNVEKACAVGITAVNLAVQAPKAGNTDLALALDLERTHIPDTLKSLAIPEAAWDVFRTGGNYHTPVAMGKGIVPPPRQESDQCYSNFIAIYAAMCRWHMKTYGTTQHQIATVHGKTPRTRCTIRSRTSASHLR